MNMSQAAVAAPTGRRMMTFAHLAARSAARTFASGSSRLPGHYIGALKRAAPMIGIPRRVVDFVDTLFAYSQPQDWEDGRPIVWPSNDELMDVFGLSRSGVQNLIRAAIATGIVVMEDSPNGHRYGYRDPSGHISRAFGFNLAPLAARFDEFTVAFEARKAARNRRRALRARATHLRNDIVELAALGDRSYAKAADWKAIHERAYTLWVSSRPIDDPDSLEPFVAALQHLRDDAETLIHRLSKPVETKPMGSACEADNTATTNPQASKEATKTVHSTPNHTVGRPSGRPRLAEESSSGREGTAQPAGIEPSQDDALRGFPATPETILEIAPTFRDFTTSTRPKWREIVDAARLVAGSLGISQHAWGEACMVLGRPQAAVAVAVITARHSRGDVKSAGGFLRALVERHRVGTLHLDRTLYGLTKRPLH